MSESAYDEPCGLEIRYVGGGNDGLTFVWVDDDDCGYFVSDSYPGQRFKQVFVPLEMEHSNFII